MANVVMVLYRIDSWNPEGVFEVMEMVIVDASLPLEAIVVIPGELKTSVKVEKLVFMAPL